MIRLTPKEEEIMQILWQLEKAFVKDIIAQLPQKPDQKPIRYTTVSSLVRLLEEKGHVGHKAYGKTHEYFPILRKEDYRKQFMGNVVKGYFANSYQSVISMFAREEKISVDELRALIEQIESEKPNQDD
ncbi:MAG: BlaI/MecI/CopY family transcriptional regulator [Bacteroidota bacterium]